MVDFGRVNAPLQPQLAAFSKSTNGRFWNSKCTAASFGVLVAHLQSQNRAMVDFGIVNYNVSIRCRFIGKLIDSCQVFVVHFLPLRFLVLFFSTRVSLWFSRFFPHRTSSKWTAAASFGGLVAHVLS